MMKTIKLISLFGLMAFLGVSCSSSLSSDSKENLGCKENVRQVKSNTTIIVQDTLYSIISNPSLNKNQAVFFEKLRKRPTTKKIYIARLNDISINALKDKRAIVLPISPEKYVVVIGKHVIKRSDGNLSWIGKVLTGGSATLVIGPHGITGGLHYSNCSIYQLIPLGGNLQTIIHGDPTKVKPIDDLGNSN